MNRTCAGHVNILLCARHKIFLVKPLTRERWPLVGHFLNLTVVGGGAVQGNAAARVEMKVLNGQEGHQKCLTSQSLGLGHGTFRFSGESPRGEVYIREWTEDWALLSPHSVDK